MVTQKLLVVVVGGANTDYTVRGPHLPAPGETVEGSEFHESPGGKGANQAIAVARLGARSALVACVGDDERGRHSIAQLKKDGVDTRAVRREREAPTGAALILLDESGQKQILTAPGANEKLSEEDVFAAGELIASAEVVLVQLEIPLRTAAAAIRIGRAAGARVVLDPAPARPLSEEVLRDVHVIRPNSGEAEALTGIPVRDVDSARQAAMNLIRRGAGAACVGAPAGNLLVSPEGELWLPHLPLHAVDKTGAGDAFAGGLAAALARAQPLDVAFRFAHAAAALKTTKLGAQTGLPRDHEVFDLVRSAQTR
jgi:ribokinase